MTFIATAGFAFLHIVLKVFYPDLAPKGVTTMLLVIFFFGSVTLLAISLLGEYIAKIFEEVQVRPRFIRKHFIKNGTLKSFNP